MYDTFLPNFAGKICYNIVDAKMDSYQKTAEASMAKLEQMEETMERQMKHLMMAKWNTHQEVTEIDPDTEMMQSVEDHQEETKTPQKNLNRTKLWTAQGVGRRRNEDDPPCKSGMAQGKLRQEGLDQEPGRPRNPEITKGREETVERSGIQRWLKGKPETATTQRNRNKGPRHKTASAY
jgi:hypothetical protein